MAIRLNEVLLFFHLLLRACGGEKGKVRVCCCKPPLCTPSFSSFAPLQKTPSSDETDPDKQHPDRRTSKQDPSGRSSQQTSSQLNDAPPFPFDGVSPPSAAQQHSNTAGPGDDPPRTPPAPLWPTLPSRQRSRSSGPTRFLLRSIPIVPQDVALLAHARSRPLPPTLPFPRFAPPTLFSGCSRPPSSNSRLPTHGDRHPPQRPPRDSLLRLR